MYIYIWQRLIKKQSCVKQRNKKLDWRPLRTQPEKNMNIKNFARPDFCKQRASNRASRQLGSQPASQPGTHPPCPSHSATQPASQASSQQAGEAHSQPGRQSANFFSLRNCCVRSTFFPCVCFADFDNSYTKNLLFQGQISYQLSVILGTILA